MNIKSNGKSRMESQYRYLSVALALFAAVNWAEAQGTTVFPIATSPSVIEYSDGIAFDGTNYLVEMLTGTNGSAVTNVVVQLVSATGALLGSQIVVGGGSSLQSSVGLAFGQTNYLVVWSDSTISGVDMFGQFISRSGAKVGSRFILLASQGTNGFQTVKALASDGVNFLVVWQDQSSYYFYGQLVSPSGTLIGSEFLISDQKQEGSTSASAVFGTTNYFVIWQSDNGTTEHALTFGEFVSTSGSAGSPFQIGQTPSTDESGVGGVAAAFDGTNYLVVWMWNPGPETGGSVTNEQIYGRLVSQTGSFPGSELVLTTNRDQVLPSLAFDGANYLLTYGYDSNTTNADANFFCQFVDPSGNLAGPTFTPFAPQGTNLPLVALNGILFDGSRYAIAGTVGSFGESGEVFGAFVRASTAPPNLATTGSLVGAQFPLQVSGTPGINYTVQVTTNLNLAIWTSLVTNSPTNGPFSFNDTNATNTSRFYRAVKQ